jgi:SAM-dependent methyltransferase
MKPDKDAFGQEMLAYFNGKDDYEIVERDDGYMSVSSGPRAYFAGYGEWPEYERKAMEYADGSVLDVGCGAGRHALYLQQKGLDATGIDNSPLAIKVCKLRGLKKAKTMSITDVGRFRSGSFDTILLMCGNFGLLGNPRKAKAVLKEFRRITSPQALIIASCTDPYKTSDRDNLEYHRLNRRRGRLPGQIRIRVRFKKYIGEWLEYLFASKMEMERILKGTGWKITEIIESGESRYIAIIGKE